MRQIDVKRTKELIYQTHFQNFSKVSAFNSIISFNEDFSQATLSNRIVFGVELVKPMKCVAILDIHNVT